VVSFVVVGRHFNVWLSFIFSWNFGKLVIVNDVDSDNDVIVCCDVPVQLE